MPCIVGHCWVVAGAGLAVRACWRAGAGVECWRLGWRLGAGKKTKKKPVGWVLQQRVSFSARGGGSSLIPRGFVPGVMYPVKMLPYPHPVAGDREVETRLRVRVGAGLCQQRVSFSASNPPHFETSKPIQYAPQLISCITFFFTLYRYCTVLPGHRTGRAPGHPGTVYCAVSYCCI